MYTFQKRGIIINKEKILNDSFDIYFPKKFKKMTGVPQCFGPTLTPEGGSTVFFFMIPEFTVLCTQWFLVQFLGCS